MRSKLRHKEELGRRSLQTRPKQNSVETTAPHDDTSTPTIIKHANRLGPDDMLTEKPRLAVRESMLKISSQHIGRRNINIDQNCRDIMRDKFCDAQRTKTSSFLKIQDYSLKILCVLIRK